MRICFLNSHTHTQSDSLQSFYAVAPSSNLQIFLHIPRKYIMHMLSTAEIVLLKLFNVTVTLNSNHAPTYWPFGVSFGVSFRFGIKLSTTCSRTWVSKTSITCQNKKMLSRAKTKRWDCGLKTFLHLAKPCFFFAKYRDKTVFL